MALKWIFFIYFDLPRKLLDNRMPMVTVPLAYSAGLSSNDRIFASYTGLAS